jgi:hypothetical protein
MKNFNFFLILFFLVNSLINISATEIRAPKLKRQASEHKETNASKKAKKYILIEVEVLIVNCSGRKLAVYDGFSLEKTAFHYAFDRNLTSVVNSKPLAIIENNEQATFSINPDNFIYSIGLFLLDYGNKETIYGNQSIGIQTKNVVLFNPFGSFFRNPNNNKNEFVAFNNTEGELSILTKVEYEEWLKREIISIIN